MSFMPPGWREKGQKQRRRFTYLLLAIIVMILLGALGFRLIEGWSFANSLYVAVQTVTTVGYGDVVPESRSGRAFATIFMLAGVGTVLYALTTTVQAVVESEILATLGIRRRYREMKRLEQHFIICGAGRVGARIIREMQ
ncbi:MAG: two pore domain potassium channel family protein, partial [Acidobacteria bacterium]|nr:two pore domain potassium channel family protein [Acidobacteriota bacterium]